MSNRAIALSEIRRHFGTYATLVRDGEHIEITDHGYPFAVLVPIADYQKMRTDADIEAAQ